CLRRARRHPEGAPRRRQRRADTRKPAADEEALPRRVAEEIGRDPRCRYGVNTAVVHWWVDVHWTTIRLLSMVVLPSSACVGPGGQPHAGYCGSQRASSAAKRSRSMMFMPIAACVPQQLTLWNAMKHSSARSQFLSNVGNVGLGAAQATT